MSATLQRHALGITWMEHSRTVRTAHALASEEQVWLIDPFDDEPALQAAATLGRPAGVLQLLDCHNRDCDPIATRLGVQLLRVPDRAPDTPFEVVPVLSRPGWKEVALWWAQERALIVAEAVGTATAFALGRRAGVHPVLRLTPPRSQLSAYRPEMLLVGVATITLTFPSKNPHDRGSSSRSVVVATRPVENVMVVRVPKSAAAPNPLTIIWRSPTGASRHANHQQLLSPTTNGAAGAG
jgi:hypothetical protein